MKNKSVLLFIWIVFLSACGQASDNANDSLYSKLEAEEIRTMKVYFTNDIGSSISALREYITYLNSAEKNGIDKDVHRFIKSGRALAIVRLEFALAHAKGKKVDLGMAIKDFRQIDVGTESMGNKQCAVALIGMIRDDTKRVSWLNEFDRIANETLMALGN